MDSDVDALLRRATGEDTVQIFRVLDGEECVTRDSDSDLTLSPSGHHSSPQFQGEVSCLWGCEELGCWLACGAPPVSLFGGAPHGKHPETGAADSPLLLHTDSVLHSLMNVVSPSSSAPPPGVSFLHPSPSNGATTTLALPSSGDGGGYLWCWQRQEGDSTSPRWAMTTIRSNITFPDHLQVLRCSLEHLSVALGSRAHDCVEVLPLTLLRNARQRDELRHRVIQLPPISLVGGVCIFQRAACVWLWGERLLSPCLLSL